MKDGKATDDSVNRLKFYAESLNKYLILVLCLKKENLSPRTIGNMEVVPTGGRGYLLALFRMYRLGKDILKKEEVDIIQAQEAYMTGLVGVFLKRKFKKPLNICVYGSNPFDKYWRSESKFNFSVAPLARFVMKRADGIQVDGTLTKERLIKAGIKAGKIFFKPMIPSNIADFDSVSGEQVRAQLVEVGRFKEILLFVGRMAKQKNIPFLLRAFKEVLKSFPKTRLVMVGGGHYQDVYKKLAVKLGVEQSVLWTGDVSHDEMPKYFKAADLFVLTSYYEGFPRVFMESAAAGLPVVTTLVSGVGDGVIDEETGLVVSQGDLEGWVARAKKLLADPRVKKEFGARAQQFYKQHLSDPRVYDQRQIEIWEKISS